MVCGMKLRRSVPLLLTVLTAGVAGFFAGRMFPAAGESAGPGKGAKVVPLAARESSRAAAGPAAGKGAAQAMSPQAARMLARLEERLNMSGYSSERLSKMLGTWLAECPSEVLGFLEESPRRDELLLLGAKAWGRSDAKGISEWLASQGEFAGRDAIVAGLAPHLAGKDEETAIAWIASIKDPAQKIIAAQDSGYWFYRHSDEAAREAFRKMGLPDSAFDSLITEEARQTHRQSSYDKAHHFKLICESALEAGAEFAPQSISEAYEALTKGITVTKGSTSTIFRVSATDWTPREVEDTLNYLEVSDGKVRLKDE